MWIHLPNQQVAAAANKLSQPAATAVVAAAPPAISSNSSCGCLQANPEELIRVCSIVPVKWPDDLNNLIDNCMTMLAHNHSQYLNYQQQQDKEAAGGTACRQQLLIHTFWAGPMVWKLKAVIQSFLFTHHTTETSCRPKPVLHVWLSTQEPTRYAVSWCALAT